MIGWPEAVEECAVDLDAGGVAVTGGVVPLASQGGGEPMRRRVSWWAYLAGSD